MEENNILEEEEERKEKIIEILAQIKNSIKNNKLETFESLNKILEQLKIENEKFQVLIEIFEKIRNKKDLDSNGLLTFINYKFEKYIFDYIKELIKIADAVYFHFSSDRIILQFEIKILQENVYETFAEAELMHTRAINQHIYINNTDVNESFDKILNALVSLILDIKATLQYYYES
jgi:hypothetical protein